MLFFDWFYPFSTVLLKGISANYDNRVMVSVLRFFSEFVQNKSQRLNFDVSSPGGILLFRETSKIVCTAGGLLLGKTVSESRKWQDLYKPVSLCFNILRWALVGKYVNFGVFSLYNDQAFNDAMSMYFQLLVHVPLADMMSFPKLTQSSILLFQVFSSDQIQALSDIDSQVFLYMMQLCAEGLKSSDSQVSSQIAISIDYIFTFVVKQKMLSNTDHYLVIRTGENPNVVTFIMSRLLELVLFEDHPSQWTFTRALLPLVLANKEFFDFYTTTLVKGQLPERREVLQKSILGIMEDVEFSLLPRNRDKFTQQLINFRREIVSSYITLVMPRELSQD